MTVIPFLDRNDVEQYKQLEALYAVSNFLLFPTRNDCTPIVCCEASAYGLPVITADTGAVSEVVSNGENGFVLPYNARGGAYAEVIARLYRDEQHYTALMKKCRDLFEQRLNWDTWGSAIKQVLVAVQQ